MGRKVYEIMDARQLAECFNDKSSEFVSDLCRLVPNDADFRAFKTSLALMTAVDPSKAIRMFASLVSVPYRGYIEGRDDQFFLSERFRDSHSDNFVQALISKVSSYWTNEITDEERRVVWDYLTVLHALADQHQRKIA